MAVHEFVFALRLSATDGADGMLKALAAAMLQYVGCPSATAANLAAGLSTAVANSNPRGSDVDVRFLAERGELEILASRGGEPGPFWRGACRLP